MGDVTMDGDCASIGMICEEGHGALWEWLFKVIRCEIPQKLSPMAFTFHLKRFSVFLFGEKAGKGGGNGVMRGSSLPIPLDFRNVK